MNITERITSWARRIKRDAVTLWFAYRDTRTPWAAKALCAFVVAYALSPIDLIPDFIPVLGYLDDALLLPALIWVAVKLLPSSVIVDSRFKADDWMQRHGRKPVSRVGAAVIISMWLTVMVSAWVWWRR